MGLLQTISPSTIGIVILFFFPVLVIHRILRAGSYPLAPGPKAAPYTDWWYLWKVYSGSFEQWNIKQHSQHGKVLRVAPQMYSISDPASLQTIYSLSSPMPKSNWYKAFGDPLVPNHNLFSAVDPTVHASMRRKVASLYTMTAISKYEMYVDNCIQLLISKFERLADTGEQIDLQLWMQCYAFDVVGEITYGSRVGFLEAEGRDIDGIIAGIDKVNTLSTLMGIDKKSVPLLLLMNGNPISTLDRWVKKATEARARLSKNGAFTDQEAGDFFSKLQSIKEKDPEEYKRHKVENILIANIGAGSDTTSISLTATLYFLATNPAVLQKLRAEIRDAAHQNKIDDPITFEQAQKLPYLQAVIKETLRLWPATGLPLWRVVQKPGAKIADTFFPPGAIVGVNPWVFHHNPAVFGPDHNTFRPDRWIDSSTDQLKDMEHCFITFGLGTRTCLGRNISLLEMTKVIPELVRRYDFEMLEQRLQSTNHWFVKPRNVYAKIRKAKID